MRYICCCYYLLVNHFKYQRVYAVATHADSSYDIVEFHTGETTTGRRGKGAYLGEILLIAQNRCRER
jgi:hypothetical protein